MSKWISSVMATVVGALVIGFFATMYADNINLKRRVAGLENNLEAVRNSNALSKSPDFDQLTVKSIKVMDSDGKHEVAYLGSDAPGRGLLEVRDINQGKDQYMARVVAGGRGGVVQLMTKDFRQIVNIYGDDQHRGWIQISDHTKSPPSVHAEPTTR